MGVQVISFDVKPANVLLDRSMKHAKLADVGLAKVLERSLTMTVMVCIFYRSIHQCKLLMIIRSMKGHVLVQPDIMDQTALCLC